MNEAVSVGEIARSNILTVRVPAEAVDPRTVRPGVLGELTERAYDGRRR